MRNYLFLILCVTLAGCASVVMYEGDIRPDEEVAKLSTSLAARIKEVNGKENVERGGGLAPIAVLPGEIEVVVSMFINDGIKIRRSLADQTIYFKAEAGKSYICLLYTSPSPRDQRGSRMPSSA